jgi:hypothetical protein
VLTSLLPLARYLRREKPAAMLSALKHANVIAIPAWEIARVETRLLVSEHDSLTARAEGLTGRVVRISMQLLFPAADAVVCSSRDIDKDMPRLLGVPADKVVTIHNPVDIDTLRRRSNTPVNHPWLSDSETPVLLVAGGLTPQKDYPTLLAAFAQLLAFLDLPPPVVPVHLSAQNSAHQPKSRMVTRLIRLGSTVRQAPGTQRGLGLLTRLRNANKQVGNRQSLAPAFETELRRHFNPEVRKLEVILNLDLSHWRAP